MAKPTRKPPETLGAFLSDYLATNAPLWSFNTQRTYASITNTLSAELGGVVLTDLTVKDLEKYRNTLLSKTGPHRVKMVMRFLRQVLEDARKDGLLALNPCDNVKRVRVPKTIVNPLQPAELECVLANMPPHWVPWFRFLAFTGMRPSEAAALTFKDFDPDKGIVVIRAAVSRGHMSLTKTDAGMRVVTLLPDALSVLQDRVGGPDDLIFTMPSGKPVDPNTDRVWRKACARAGVDHRPSYQLRHTFASWALASGCDLGWLSSQLGHKSITTTLNAYARHIPNDGNIQVAKLVDYLAAR